MREETFTYSTIGSSVTIKTFIKNAIAAETINRDNLGLTRSPNWNLPISTLLHRPVSNESRIRLDKEDYEQMGIHKLLERTLLQLA